MTSLFKLLFTLGFSLALVQPGLAGPPRKVPAPPPGKRWAIVVGINYDKQKRDPALGDVGTLRNAEKDATDFAEILKNCYGYGAAGSEIHLLVGPDATRASIERLMQNAFLLNADKVGPDDTVIVYFSGHGYLNKSQAGTKAEGYLLPFDVRFDKSGVLDWSTAIRFSDALIEPLKQCKARQKLLILDCCHSGAVFRVEDGVIDTGADDERIDADLASAGTFQALTASREYQEAQDGEVTAGNSPFTSALIFGLSAIPQRKSGGPFIARELFKSVDARLFDTLKHKQSPQCRRIGGDPYGEFVFVPVEGARYKTVDMSPDARRILMASVPSTFGNWWADEMPWFMPSLRLEIIDSGPRTKSAEAYLDPEMIRRTAFDLVRARSNKPGNTADYRYEHLFKLLAAESTAKQARAIDEIIESLKARAKQNPAAASACDLHYCAVLLQKRGRLSEARELYEQAEQAYEVEIQAQPLRAPLHALCLMDHGILCLNTLNQYTEATDLFRLSRSKVGDDLPVPFEVFTYARESESYRRRGLFRLSDKVMLNACDSISRFDPSRSLPLSASVWKQNALACMEQCRFEKSKTSFEMCRSILDGLIQAQPDNYLCKIERFHVDHGLAMIERFQGQDVNALASFRKLTASISEEILALQRSEEPVPNHESIRQLLCERYVNSVDRQADCMLFGRVPDYAEAADDYRRALRVTPALRDERKEQTRIDLLYRRATAIGMDPSGDVSLARKLCREAQTLEDELKAKNVLALPRKTVLMGLIARALTRDEVGETAIDPVDQLVVQFVTKGQGPASSAGQSLDRDELEREMFGCKQILRNGVRWKLDTFVQNEACDQLLQICRRAIWNGRVQGGVEPGFLIYLRDYYEVAFLTKAQQNPVPVKEMIEIAWEATRGQPYMKPAEANPLLVLFQVRENQAGPQCYLLVDVPATAANGSIARCVAIKSPGLDRQKLQQASEKDQPLALPDEVYKILTEMSHAKLVVRWRDPVMGLGCSPPANSVVVSYSPGSIASESRFPFNATAILGVDRCVDRDVIDTRERATRYAVEDQPSAKLTVPTPRAPVP